VAEKKSIWKRDANEVVDPLAFAYIRWLRTWWARAIVAAITLLLIAVWVVLAR